ncbi:hypothetical protein TA3x_002472 [Tundrisphaera sp. TA3]|uniref:hypothetical protein n=1 Tax=Tundrisphaera sp. TA3 TaxID=3435775 RepID=UPI003EB9C557
MGLKLPIAFLSLATVAVAQGPKQPKVAPGPNEPDWKVVLDTKYGLSMFGDLLNPVKTTPEATPGLFRKAGPGPVTYRPVIALGLETRNKGGWYRPAADPTRKPDRTETWSYTFKNTTKDVQTGNRLPPPLADGSKVEFDPGDAPFGLWVANDGLAESDVYSQPALVAAHTKRLSKQPYKLMIYPYKDKATGQIVPNSYLLGWEYSTNDDFQDIVCRVDNVSLIIEP